MIGKLISIEKVTDRYDELTVKELESGKLLRATVDKDSCDNYVSKYISIQSSIVKLANANKGHKYPEGTIGCDKKGF